MNENEIFEKLKEMVAEQFGIEEDIIKIDSTLTDDLAADSLDMVELVMNIEEVFDINFEDEDIEKLQTLKDVVKYIENNQ